MRIFSCLLSGELVLGFGKGAVGWWVVIKSCRRCVYGHAGVLIPEVSGLLRGA